MSITDELRNHAHKYAWDGGETYDQHLIYIADRIEEELANYVELPKDADGEYIHIGDELEWLEGNRLTVNGIGEGGTLFYVDAQGDVQWTASGNKRHVQPDSWERIISEFAERVLRSGHQWGLDAPAATAEFVERCKRLAGEDA